MSKTSEPIVEFAQDSPVETAPGGERVRDIGAGIQNWGWTLARIEALRTTGGGFPFDKHYCRFEDFSGPQPFSPI